MKSKSRKTTYVVMGLLFIILVVGGWFSLNMLENNWVPTEKDLSSLNKEDRLQIVESIKYSTEEFNLEMAQNEDLEDESFLESMSSWTRPKSKTCRNSHASCRNLSCYEELSLEKNKELLIKGTALSTFYWKRAINYEDMANKFKKSNNKYYKYLIKMHNKYNNYRNIYTCIMENATDVVNKYTAGKTDITVYLKEGMRISREFGIKKKYPGRVDWSMISRTFESTEEAKKLNIDPQSPPVVEVNNEIQVRFPKRNVKILISHDAYHCYDTTIVYCHGLYVITNNGWGVSANAIPLGGRSGHKIGGRGSSSVYGIYVEDLSTPGIKCEAFIDNPYTTNPTFVSCVSGIGKHCLGTSRRNMHRRCVAEDKDGNKVSSKKWDLY